MAHVFCLVKCRCDTGGRAFQHSDQKLFFLYLVSLIPFIFHHVLLQEETVSLMTASRLSCSGASDELHPFALSLLRWHQTFLQVACGGRTGRSASTEKPDSCETCWIFFFLHVQHFTSCLVTSAVTAAGVEAGKSAKLTVCPLRGLRRLLHITLTVKVDLFLRFSTNRRAVCLFETCGRQMPRSPQVQLNQSMKKKETRVIRKIFLRHFSPTILL